MKLSYSDFAWNLEEHDSFLKSSAFKRELEKTLLRKRADADISFGYGQKTILLRRGEIIASFHIETMIGNWGSLDLGRSRLASRVRALQNRFLQKAYVSQDPGIDSTDSVRIDFDFPDSAQGAADLSLSRPVALELARNIIKLCSGEVPDGELSFSVDDDHKVSRTPRKK